MGMLDKYILNGHTPVVCDDLLRWASWFDTADRRVARTTRCGVTVSTVFLGLDHSFCRGADPILFETMVFGGKHDGYCVRTRTWPEAELRHTETCGKYLPSVFWIVFGALGWILGACALIYLGWRYL